VSFVHVLQHEQVEGLGTIAESLAAAGVAPRYVRSFAGDRIPETPGDAAGLIVMGGPMGVYETDRYPFLRDEMRLIENALKLEKPVLGVCLGSQLLAQTLGATVGPSGRKEIGWFDVRLTTEGQRDPLYKGIPNRFTAFHWHGDVYPLPVSAIPLASSDLTPLQSFRYGESAYGLLFHLETTAGIAADMVRTWPDELEQEGLDGAAILSDCTKNLSTMEGIARRIFGRFSSLL
jgi:GMP synthase (glutamine-hydrolysing)